MQFLRATSLQHTIHTHLLALRSKGAHAAFLNEFVNLCLKVSAAASAPPLMMSSLGGGGVFRRVRIHSSP